MKRTHGGPKGLAYARKYGITHFENEGEELNQQVRCIEMCMLLLTDLDALT
jgi:hypothetical protein